MKLEEWYRRTERPEERELRRALRRAAILEALGGFVVAGMCVLLFWLYLAATPPQSSAINDLDGIGGQLASGSRGSAS